MSYLSCQAIGTRAGYQSSSAGCPGAPGKLAQWMVLDPSDCLVCLSSQSASWGDNSELRTVARHQAYPGWTEFCVSQGPGWILTPTSPLWLLINPV